MKKNILIILIIAVVSSLIACNHYQKEKFDILSQRKIVEVLSDDLSKGRLPGTEGNEKTEELLSDTFKRIGLEPYKNNSFFMAYEQSFYNPDLQDNNITVIINNKKNKELVYGKDFLELLPITELSITTPITFDIEDDNLVNKVLVIKDKKQMKNIKTNPRAILVRADVFTKNIITNKDNKPIIQITPQIFDLIKSLSQNGSNLSIELSFRSKEEVILANNITGRIPGLKHEEAIVLSAHFDHVGWSGSTIFNGAIDNSSGVAVLIDVSRKLNEYYKDHELDKDIIICAFNGEESDRLGSKAFVKAIKSQYNHIYNINIDVVGIKGNNELLIAHECSTSDNLANEIYEFLLNRGYSCKLGDWSYTSDHISFSEEKISSINIGQEDTKHILHTEQDTIEQIDFDFLDSINNDLFEFIILNINQKFSPEESTVHIHTNDMSNDEKKEFEKLSQNNIFTRIFNASFFENNEKPVKIAEEVIKIGEYEYILSYDKETGENLMVYLYFENEGDNYILSLVPRDRFEIDDSKLMDFYIDTNWSIESKSEIVQLLKELNIEILLNKYKKDCVW